MAEWEQGGSEHRRNHGEYWEAEHWCQLSTILAVSQRSSKFVGVQ